MYKDFRIANDLKISVGRKGEKGGKEEGKMQGSRRENGRRRREGGRNFIELSQA
ncbi:hypothetical protein [Dyadobacter sediminis]|uniref:hypothetical protein n=1 Tax=Dyadobacter sediminis TaxID=1493691 RepID=UPI00166A1769|nr:hypothetical protein [Dyadobacter sediminis]